MLVRGSRRLLAGSVALVLVLVGTSCGSSETGSSDRSAAGLEAPVAAGALLGLPSSERLASVQLEPCQNLAARGLCQWAVNSMYTFTGPNTLTQTGGAVLTKAYDEIEHGIVTAAWPPADEIPNDPALSKHWRYESQGMFTGVETTVYYAAPQGYPVGEQVGFYGMVPYSGTSQFACRNGNFIRCRVVRSDQTNNALALYEVTNNPVVVRVTNRLGAPVTREGEPALTAFVSVPAAGDPAVVAPGATAYAGGFRSSAKDSRYSLTYVVGDGDASVSGARAVVNAVIDRESGTDKNSKCEVSNPRSTGAQLQCRVTVSGGADGVVYVDVNLSR